MNIVNYEPVDVLNGPGTRVSLFVAGCRFRCKGCFNAMAQSHTAGVQFTDDMAEQIIRDLQDTRIRRRGLSLLGGDPLFERNIEALTALVQRVRREVPAADIWLWTGEVYEALTPKQRALVSLVDVVVDGQFEQGKRSHKLAWRGSSNQRVIDVARSLSVTQLWQA
ncbi:anaerobic ribonucleoside-triphosphate reductase-activating protein [Aliagarivorans taiwanensis]|uniref:anaerobic ribonucleoside-triphosphate reductase-activating protein n=1 Tax=Aliagarivorans taiwanensis TaxID=561966 RepID=UPI000413E9E7|nr:anaerobic ribonucleoside-triphosphate reductase-activating protein [Aliagarivorans taiwanensis]